MKVPMIFAPLLLAGALVAPLAQADATPTGRSAAGGFRGYEAVNAAVRGRLIDQAAPNGGDFNLSFYLGDDSGNLARLLGGFEGGDFRNGAPNSLNMLLWYIGMSSFADDVAAAVCDAHSPLIADGSITLSPDAVAAMTPACALPDDPDTRAAVLQTLWLTTVAFDAPRAEFAEWAAGLGSPEATAGAPGRTVLAKLLTGALLDPYVLLER
jgi:hypothetical protein